MTVRRPSWLEEPCPRWCTREHREEDHPDDRYHQSEAELVPAVAGSGEAVPLTATLAATTLGVRVGRHVGDDLTWLVVEALEAPRPRLVLTTESAGALHRALGAQLELAAAGR
ncbi:hypothetical protein [Pimelobacter sp. 30-1]|uniref:DUF6907 domain-containing protein n=1 Tax=Pimelobacter sp. 30-1 TaxID=2004991 RepID=UPI001C05277D|nr:hypothetical protein [Pimelobacter sp. 30-1]